MKPNVVGFIFARGGSKGLPRKNLRLLRGKPLLAHAIEAGRASRYVQRVIVSTEDAEIAETARRYGAEVPFVRPAELATDEASERLAWRHAIHALEAMPGEARVDVLVSLPATSPLRAVEDVDACVRTLLEGDADLVITVSEARRSPYFNMVVLDDAGYARLVVPPELEVRRRQDAPRVYDMATVAYAARREQALSERPWYQSKVRAVIVPLERAVDIDTELDLQFAEFLVQRTGLAAPTRQM